MPLHRSSLRTRVQGTAAAAVLALALVGGYAAPVVAAEGSGNASAQGQGAQAEKSQSTQKDQSKKAKKKPAASQASPAKGKPASSGKSQDNGKANAPGQTKPEGSSATGKGQGSGKANAPGQTKPQGGSATGKGQTGKGNAGQVGSENGTGAAGSPPGNNGTVKIAPLGEMDGIPNNTPHPGCTFQVEWYGFDEGADVISTVSFAMQAPTQDVKHTVDGNTQVFVGGSPGRGAGNDGLDGVETYTLSFDGDPHPKQGYHVKLTVSTPRSNGNDTKTKVFWVAPCAPESEGVDEGVDENEGEDGSAVSGAAGADGAATGGSPFAGQTLTSGATVTTGSATDASGDAITAGSSSASGTAGAAVPTSVDAGLLGEWTRSWLPLGIVALGAALLTSALVLRRRTRESAV